MKLAPHTGGVFDAWTVTAVCLASIAVIFAATRIRRVPLPPALLLAAGGLTYPLYLLHMQFGYVLFTRQAPADPVPSILAIVLGMMVLAWIVWRYVERPAQRWVRDFLSNLASRVGWPLKLSATIGGGKAI